MEKKDKKKGGVSRRLFLAGSAATGAALTEGCSTFNIVPPHVLGGPRHIAPSEKLNVGIIGAGGKGAEDTRNVSSENIVALCDVDDVRCAETVKAHPSAKRYYDFREMLEKEKDLDAVTVSTPDHVHALASITAMRRGLHVYCQKPLTHSVYEARLMRKTAQKHGVMTQMGNQGTAEDGLRKAVEIVRSGAIGPVRQVHVWTNRPIWPQGIARPADVMPVPGTLKWDLWLAGAPKRPYHKAYVPFSWRGFWDFGTGALGDMACHTANMAFMALNLAYPTSIEAKSSEINNDSAPSWSEIKFEFPARGDMPPCTFMWYDGGRMPPAELGQGQKFPNSGLLLVGDKGTLFSPNDYGANFKLLPEKNFKDFQPPKPTLPRSPGHYKEWIQACKGGPKPLSNFDYAALLTETILLGNVALRVGKKMEWNGEAMKSPNCPEAAQYINPEYHNGYKL